MKNNTEGNVIRLTTGLDMGDRWSHFYIVDEAGQVSEKGKTLTCEAGLEAEFGKRPPLRIVIEAGTHSPWASRLLSGFGHEVIVANPRKLRFIYASEKKNDRQDAEVLARVGRLDAKLLAPIKHRSAEAQVALASVRARDALVAARTRLVNHVRGAVKSIGGRLPTSSTENFPRLAKYVPKEIWPALSPLIDTIGRLTTEIRRYDKRIERVAKKNYPETETLRQVNGVGPLTALTYVLTLEDPNRFAESRQVGAYLGLCPRQDSSGTIDRQLGITKTGDGFVRRLLVSAAQYMLGPFGKESALRRWGLELAKRGGKNAKRRAVVAVARKIAVLLHRLWLTKERYDPLRGMKGRAVPASVGRA